MIDTKKDPISYSIFLYELTDAKEHLESLIEEISKNHEYSEEAFRIDLGHIYAHLNRAWHSRNSEDNEEELAPDVISKFPTDLEPVG